MKSANKVNKGCNLLKINVIRLFAGAKRTSLTVVEY